MLPFVSFLAANVVNIHSKPSALHPDTRALRVRTATDYLTRLLFNGPIGFSVIAIGCLAALPGGKSCSPSARALSRFASREYHDHEGGIMTRGTLAKRQLRRKLSSSGAYRRSLTSSVSHYFSQFVALAGPQARS